MSFKLFFLMEQHGDMKTKTFSGIHKSRRRDRLISIMSIRSMRFNLSNSPQKVHSVFIKASQARSQIRMLKSLGREPPSNKRIVLKSRKEIALCSSETSYTNCFRTRVICNSYHSNCNKKSRRQASSISQSNYEATKARKLSIQAFLKIWERLLYSLCQSKKSKETKN